MKISSETLLDNLREFYKIHERSPFSKEFSNKKMYVREFGSWNNALALANLPLNRNNSNHNKKRTNITCISCGNNIDKTRGIKYCKECTNTRYNVRNYCNKTSDQKRQFNLQTYSNQKQRGYIRKIELINYLGGKCSICGYDKNLAALAFHHESKKEISLDMRHISGTSMNRLYKEIEGCIVLCHNCHMELHYPDLSTWTT